MITVSFGDITSISILETIGLIKTGGATVYKTTKQPKGCHLTLARAYIVFTLQSFIVIMFIKQ